MATSVYFSNENIVVVSGDALKNTVRVSSLITLPLYEGTMINGMVINDEVIKANLTKLRSKGILPRKGVKLVIDRSSILVKFLKIPNIKPKQLMELIKNTFSGAAEARNELVYDYSIIEKSKVKSEASLVLGSAIEKSLVDDYMSLFESAGIELSSIDIALNSVLKFQSYCNEFKKRTFIISFMDAENIFSLLFVEGKYSFSNRYRLISKRGTSESASEIANFISTIIQFNQTQKNNQDINLALFCGLNNYEDGLCQELASSLNIRVEPYLKCMAIVPDNKIKGRENDLMKNFFAVSNLI